MVDAAAAARHPKRRPEGTRVGSCTTSWNGHATCGTSAACSAAEPLRGCKLYRRCPQRKASTSKISIGIGNSEAVTQSLSPMVSRGRSRVSVALLPFRPVAKPEAAASAAVAAASPTRWVVLSVLTSAYGAGAFGMLGLSPLSPSLLDGFDLTRLEVAFILPAVYVGGLFFSLPGGRLADRIGVRPSFFGGLALGATGLLAAALAPTFPLFLACLIVAGIGWSVVNPALGRAIVDLFPPRERGMAMGIKQMGLTLGGVASAVVLPAVSAALGWRAGVGACAAALALPIALTWRSLSALATGTDTPAPTAVTGSPAPASGGGCAAPHWSSSSRRDCARDGAGRRHELSAAVRDPGARVRQDRRRPARRVLAGGRCGRATGAGRRERPLAGRAPSRCGSG